MKIQDFRDALKDDEVKQLFAEIIERKIDTKLNQLKVSLTNEFNTRIDELSVTLTALRSEVQRKDTLMGALQTENNSLKASIKSLNEKLDDTETYQRRDNLIFTGLPLRLADLTAGSNDPLADSSESIATQVSNFCINTLRCDVKIEDISVAHALKVHGGHGQQPVIVRFSRRSIRDDVYYSRMKLKSYKTPAGNKVYINEDLTTPNRKILGVARNKLRDKHIAGVWTKSGRVFYKDNSGVTNCLRSLQDAVAL
jgi:hypothetical protein